MENLIGILAGILIISLALYFLSKSTTSKADVNLSNNNNVDVDEHLEMCKKNAELRNQKAQEKLDKIRAKNNETRNRTNKTNGLIELNKTKGKTEAQKEEELAQAIQSGWIYKSK